MIFHLPLISRLALLVAGHASAPLVTCGNERPQTAWCRNGDDHAAWAFTAYANDKLPSGRLGLATK